MQKILELIDVSVSYGNDPVIKNISLTIQQGEQWAIVGNSGSGKTTLAHVLEGKIFYSGEVRFNFPKLHNPRVPIALVEQQHWLQSSSAAGEYYYQQRFHSVDADDAITVEKLLNEHCNLPEDQRRSWIDALHLTPLLQRSLVQLSNGENKRLQIAQALFENPALLVFDNPFIGLDSEGCARLNTILKNICDAGTHIILLSSRKVIPDCITHVAELRNGKIITAIQKEKFYAARPSENHRMNILPRTLPDQFFIHEDFSTAVRMVNVTVRYGEKTILDGIDWNVNRGECWCVAGPNGAGKSTLLSLITADNPQAYANEMYLFDRRRGSGESIWDIKRNIGFVSPELHVSFPRNLSCKDVIASGLFDSIGVYRKISGEDQKRIDWWIDALRFQNIRSTMLSSLSLGQQRMIFLARALIKNPPVLILDEPCQGLDDEQAASFKQLVDDVCRTFHTTLIYVSHIENDIPSCVMHVLRIEQGKVVDRFSPFV